MKYAIITDGKVSNVVVSDSPLADNWVASEIANVGDFWDGENFTTPEKDNSDLIKQQRLIRDGMLQACDWVVVKSLEKSEAIPQEWVIYRQALRDVPQQSGFPEEIIWPVPPA